MSTPVWVSIKWTTLIHIPSNSLSKSTPAPFPPSTFSESDHISSLLQTFNTLLLLLLSRFLSKDQKALGKMSIAYLHRFVSGQSQHHCLHFRSPAFFQCFGHTTVPTPPGRLHMAIPSLNANITTPLWPPLFILLNDYSVFRSHLRKHFLRKASPDFSNLINFPSFRLIITHIT